MSLYRRLKVLTLLLIELDEGSIVPFIAIVSDAGHEILFVSWSDISFKVFFPIKGSYEGTFLEAKIVAKFLCRLLIELLYLIIFGVKHFIEHICCVIQSEMKLILSVFFPSNPWRGDTRAESDSTNGRCIWQVR